MNWFSNSKLNNELTKFKKLYEETKKELDRSVKKETLHTIELETISKSKEILVIKLQEYEAKIKESEKIIKEFEKFGKRDPYGKNTESYTELERKCYTGVFDFDKGVIGFANGWKIYDFTEEKNKMNSNLEKSSVFVSTVGLFGKGKTFLHSKICGYDLPHGISYHTRGISFRLLDRVVLMDTEGKFKIY